jgi:XTP/dITP diphosphohydrolase
MTLTFASNNQHKLKEIQALSAGIFMIRGLEESGFFGEIPEDYDSLEENASQKAWYVYNRIHKNCFADDTGLEVEALNGDPGVYSARYSRMNNPVYTSLGINKANIRKLLDNLENHENRKARFRTVISLIINGEEFRFEGTINGEILKNETGMKGFGYDPVFKPEGYSMSFAEMNLSEKNSISHRAKALNSMMNFLKSLKA